MPLYKRMTWSSGSCRLASGTLLALLPALFGSASYADRASVDELTAEEAARPWEEWTESQLREKGWIDYDCCRHTLLRGAEGRRWPRNDPGSDDGTCITYSFIEEPFGVGPVPLCFALPNQYKMLPAGRNASVTAAVLTWEGVADVHLTLIADSFLPFNAAGAFADVRIGAHDGSAAGFDHGDGPGTGVPLAHGFYPPVNGVTAAGDVHFRTSEPWYAGPLPVPGGSIDLETVALHELGHALGLDHAGTVAGDVMFGTYTGVKRVPSGGGPGRDVNVIQGIYGAPGHAFRGECAVVAVETETWGGMKAKYR